MNHFIYIIYSLKVDKYYIGETECIQKRLEIHNSGTFKNSSTKTASDWQVVIAFIVNDRVEARIIEKFIKAMKSRKFIESLVSDNNFYLNFIALVYKKYNISILKY
ncbi:MAG: GIY-YIG nuclease family protein [Chitinophagaceae bacterium]|nr:GIY-YIG nuclease family protein [Chitinophagaceae bacterium]